MKDSTCWEMGKLSWSIALGNLPGHGTGRKSQVEWKRILEFKRWIRSSGETIEAILNERMSGKRDVFPIHLQRDVQRENSQRVLVSMKPNGSGT